MGGRFRDKPKAAKDPMRAPAFVHNGKARNRKPFTMAPDSIKGICAPVRHRSQDRRDLPHTMSQEQRRSIAPDNLALWTAKIARHCRIEIHDYQGQIGYHDQIVACLLEKPVCQFQEIMYRTSRTVPAHGLEGLKEIAFHRGVFSSFSCISAMARIS
jgi:hypothetical protein